ncbi:FKBP-type peptidyl-prolyl cis-trans isomerase [Persicitalea jodogahamensis]|uniref:Peptidyl-prolyl cis-trans isomerase n=1 Tax=Persicitalea jodogahamensis TaxID=402147 RepID=A0A8J3D6Q4_9BACT|nr:FKBP-type peptidyl-prolyl cis-trans isomerase [Persicitalea jodogahamensis]GHB82118.1 peptidyl-prolyl cis-trans isomerase [Persicitalea jodogahamensis]
MNIEKNKVVSLSYNLSLPDADNTMSVVEIVNAEDPLLFIFGMSGLPEKFEEQLNGLTIGDTFDFTIDPEEGYGDYDDEAVVELAKSLFEAEGVDLEEMLQPGHIIPMTNEEGETLQGMVIDVDDDSVMMDFNHPLAGKSMRFEGAVLDIREATETELEHGHVHGADGEMEH